MKGEHRRIGLTSATFLVIANMLGSGVFTLGGLLLVQVPSPWLVILLWLLGGGLAVCGALCYGALGQLVPESGGEFTILAKVHPLLGFLSGWLSVIVGFTIPIAVAALSMQAYLQHWLPHTWPATWVACAFILLAGLLHGLYAQYGLLLQNFVVIIKLLLIFVFITLALWLAPDQKFDYEMPQLEFYNIGLCLVWISFAYSGWNAAIYIAGEIKQPRRNLPVALLVGTLIVILIYLGLNTVFLMSAPMYNLAGVVEIGMLAANNLGGEIFRDIVTVIILLALFSSISAMLMAGPKVIQRMAHEGLLSRAVQNRISPPTAYLLQSLLASLVVFFGGLTQLLSYIGFTLGLSSMTCVIVLVYWRQRLGAHRVVVPGYPWIPGIYIVVTTMITASLVWSQMAEAVAGLCTVIIGALIYRFMQRQDQEDLAN